MAVLYIAMAHITEHPFNALFMQFQNEKRYYTVGEEAEVVCLDGHRRRGYQFLRCLPDKTWSEHTIKCERKNQNISFNAKNSNKVL